MILFKKKFNAFSLKWKLLLVPVVATLCFTAYLIYSSLVLSTGNALLKEFRDADIPILDMAEKNINDHDRLVDALNTAAATGEVDFLDIAKNKASEIQNHYETLEMLDAGHKHVIEKLKSDFNDYFVLALDVAHRMATKKDLPNAHQILKMRDARNEYLTGSLAYRKAAESDFHGDIRSALEKSVLAKKWGAGIGTFMLLVIAALTLLVTRGILALEKGIADRNLKLAEVNRELEREIELLKIAEEGKSLAEEISHIKDEFLANMSHEIRTPMNAIIGLTQLTLDTDLSPKQRNHLRMVHTSSKSLLKILDDILDYSKVEAGKLVLEQVEFSLDEVMKNVSDLFSAKIAEKGLKFFLDINFDLQSNLIGDSHRLAQVLNNLVGNAIKFTEHGEIHLKAETLAQDDERIIVRFAVQDTGIGMDQSQVDMLFNAFSQADSSITRRYGGTGLGLAISKQLVEMMGSNIDVSSVRGVGSTFAFKACFKKGGKNSKLHSQQANRCGRVLIVDDQQTALVLLEHYLQTWQFDVTGTTSGKNALDLIMLAEREGHPYDILIVDWQLPGMNGLELLKHVEASARNGELKRSPAIIMITAYDRGTLFREAGAIHIDEVLIKPITPAALFDSLIRVQQPQHSPKADNLGTLNNDFRKLAAPIRGARLLIVEDNDINQEVAMEFLTQAGLITAVANHGLEAFERVQKERFDAVLMDLQMPVMDGYMATKLIRDLPQGKDLPIIALSAAAMIRDKQASEQAGMNDHVSKPLDPVQLITTLLKWIKHGTGIETIKDKEGFSPPATSFSFAKIPGFDFDMALARLGGNQALLIKLLLRFAADYASTFSQVEEFLRENQSSKAMALLHRINGASATLGATDLAKTARQFENEIKSGNAPQSQETFAKHLDEAIKAINNHLQPQRQQEKSPLSPPNMAIVNATLANLAVGLNNHEMLADDKLAELLSNIRGYVPAPLLSELEDHLNGFDFESASAALAKIVVEWRTNSTSLQVLG